MVTSPLQFYTPFQVIGGLQGHISPSRPPDWVVSRYEIRYDRDYQLQDSEQFIKEKLSLADDYQAIVVPWEDEPFGNRADPYSRRFVPAAIPLAQAVIYKDFPAPKCPLTPLQSKNIFSPPDSC